MSINATLFVQAVVFAILVWFTMKFVWPPIAAALDERANKIADGLAAADRAKSELNAANQRVEQELAKSLDPQPQANPFEGPQGQGEGLAESALGLKVLTMNPDYAAQLGVPAATRGVVIAGIDPASDAANRPLQRRDIIVSANMVPIAGVQDLDRAVREAKSAGRPTITLQILRPGQAGLVYIALRIG